MAKNDTILLDGILDDRIAIKLPSDRRDEAFEYFAVEQILKDMDMSKEDIISGFVDGQNDGGIDAVYIFVNGHLLSEIEQFPWPKAHAELEIYVITCKHHSTFKQAPLDNMVATISEIFDFGIESIDLKGDYNDEILKQRELFKAAYRKISSKLKMFTIIFSYASRGDVSIIGDSIVSRGNQIASTAKQLFGNCVCHFKYYGASELVSLSRKTPNFTLELPFIETLAKGERYVLLSLIEDYYNFVTDENGKLRRYLFDSNVRDFMGQNRVNLDIQATLENDNSPDFWWLNNGVTILSTSARVIGKTIHIEDIQIVNGLQTTESIFRYFSSSKKDVNNRAILIKVIVSKDEEIRDSIIRATNNQTNVELSSLHATDKIQRDIEDILKKFGLYYERRLNHYTNQGISSDMVISPLYLASGYSSFILKKVSSAPNLKSKFMKNKESYESIFSEKTPIELWAKIGLLLKRTDSILEKVKNKEKIKADRFLKKWRYIVSYLSVAFFIKKFDFNIPEFADMNIDNLGDDLIENSWRFVNKNIPMPEKFNTIPIGFIIVVFQLAATDYGISGLDFFKRINGMLVNSNNDDNKKSKITHDFVETVDLLLPEQPWKIGTHHQIAEKLNCTNKDIYDAVKVLIKKGRRYKQKNGILYDKSGKVVKVDLERVDPITLKLIKNEDNT